MFNRETHLFGSASCVALAMFVAQAGAQSPMAEVRPSAAPSDDAARRFFSLGAHPNIESARVMPGVFLPTGGAPCPEEPPLENYTITGNTVAVPGFGQGEECAVILQAPAEHYPIEIIKIRIGWSSVFGGTGQQLQDALRIYPAGLPDPGDFQYEVLGPVLTDGGINEFDLTSVSGKGSRIINSGPFTVSLRMGETMTPSDPAPNHDANGCQAGKNAILVNGTTWFSSCVLGVSGDWIMSVVYRQVECGQGAIDCNNNGVNDAEEIAANPSLDCNANGMLDSCEITETPSLDGNGNGVIDSCEPPCNGDLNGDGMINGVDLAIVLTNWGVCGN